MSRLQKKGKLWGQVWGLNCLLSRIMDLIKEEEGLPCKVGPEAWAVVCGPEIKILMRWTDEEVTVARGGGDRWFLLVPEKTGMAVDLKGVMEEVKSLARRWARLWVEGARR